MLDSLNDNKFFLGIMILVLNLGSRYLVDEFSTNPEEYSRNLVLRRVAVFAMCFVGTRELITSLMLTAAFVTVAQGISSKSREGYQNATEKAGKPKVDQPAHDTSTPPMFVDKQESVQSAPKKQ